MGSFGVLIDAGLPGSDLERRLRAVGVDPSRIRALILTHEHRDHSAGLGIFARRYRIPAYIVAGVETAVERTIGLGVLKGVEVRSFEPGEVFEEAGLHFTPFATSHDSQRSVGFRVEDGAAHFGFATDLGEVSPEVAAMLEGVDALLLESNHDEVMLKDGPYPAFVKARVRSKVGHLSNGECASMVANLLHRKLKALILAHLSTTNNLPKLAFEATRQKLAAAGAQDEVNLLVARQDRPGTMVKI